jgi:Tfp pilus assembly protein PilF
LNQGLARTNDVRFRSSLATIHAAWADFLAKNQAPLADRVLLLERGLQIDPSNAALLERFLRVLETGGPEAEQARTRLRGLLTEGKATASVHFTLGVDAWLHGQSEAARTHFEAADKLAPQSPIILNNLAWIGAHDKNPDLTKALKLVQLALDRQPDAVLYRGTRGVILSRMERWKDALPDLEAAIARDPKNPDIHLALAESYEHLGDREMATRHRDAAKAATTPEGTTPAQAGEGTARGS